MEDVTAMTLQRQHYSFTIPLSPLIRFDPGRSASALYQWEWKDSPCCGVDIQSIKHIAQDCPSHAFSGSLEDMHEPTPEVIA